MYVAEHVEDPRVRAELVRRWRERERYYLQVMESLKVHEINVGYVRPIEQRLLTHPWAKHTPDPNNNNNKTQKKKRRKQ